MHQYQHSIVRRVTANNSHRANESQRANLTPTLFKPQRYGSNKRNQSGRSAIERNQSPRISLRWLSRTTLTQTIDYLLSDIKLYDEFRVFRRVLVTPKGGSLFRSLGNLSWERQRIHADNWGTNSLPLSPRHRFLEELNKTCI